MCINKTKLFTWYLYHRNCFCKVECRNIFPYDVYNTKMFINLNVFVLFFIPWCCLRVFVIMAESGRVCDARLWKAIKRFLLRPHLPRAPSHRECEPRPGFRNSSRDAWPFETWYRPSTRKAHNLFAFGKLAFYLWMLLMSIPVNLPEMRDRLCVLYKCVYIITYKLMWYSFSDFIKKYLDIQLNKPTINHMWH